MKPLKTIIVDDEEFARSSLFFLLQQNCPQIEIVGIAKSVAEAWNLLDSNHVEVIFLDIAMPGANGFELIPAAAKQKAAVIFTTAYDQYAIRAIKANALDYLLKPIDIDELKEAVNKVQEYLAHTFTQEPDHRIINLGNAIAKGAEIAKITLPIGHGFKMIDVDDIIYIEADSNYSVVHLNTDEKITVSKVLREFEDLLSSAQFLRIHKSTLVNLDYLVEYNNKNGLQILLKNGVMLNVSRRRATEFFEKVKSFTKP